MKQSKKILLFGITVLALLVVVLVAGIMRRESVAGGLVVNISSRGSSPLLSAAEVELALVQEFPGLTSSRVKDVDTRRIERYLRENPYVESVHSAVSVGGRILVNVTTRCPIVRVFYDGADFYIDARGHCFNARRSNNCDVIVASGFLGVQLPETISSLSLSLPDTDSNYVGDRMANVWHLAKYLDSNKAEYENLFDQIYVDADGDLILQPRLGDYEILLGDASGLDEKFDRLKRFYANGLPHAGYNSYSRINLKYKGQVVCTKKKQTNK